MVPVERQQTQEANVENLLTIRQVEERIGFKRTKIWAMRRDGRFPNPIEVEGKSLYPSHLIDEWIADRIAAAVPA